MQRYKEKKITEKRNKKRDAQSKDKILVIICCLLFKSEMHFNCSRDLTKNESVYYYWKTVNIR